jgi:steroid delta-isomerase-like uncharacterized protein
MSEELINAAKAPLQAYNDKDWDAAVACMTEDFTYDEVASHRKLEGTGAVIEAWQGWATAFPDSKATFNGAIVAGDTVIIELTWTGTHTGPMMSPGGEVPATGKSLNMRGVVINEMEGLKVKAQRQYFDLLTMMTQLGLAGG